MDYKSKVTGIGSMVSEFVEQKILIVYNDNAPPELAEMAILHTIHSLDKDVSAGDVVILGNKEYVVTAVGDEANHTLRTLGHCTFSFHGSDTARIPGHIELDGDGMPEVKEGDAFEILFT